MVQMEKFLLSLNLMKLELDPCHPYIRLVKFSSQINFKLDPNFLLNLD